MKIESYKEKIFSKLFSLIIMKIDLKFINEIEIYE